jgi:hypothetical protein
MEAEAKLTNGWVEKVPETSELAGKEQLASEEVGHVTQDNCNREISEPPVVEDGVNPEPTIKDGNEGSAVTGENKTVGTKKVHILCPFVYFNQTLSFNLLLRRTLCHFD